MLTYTPYRAIAPLLGVNELSATEGDKAAYQGLPQDGAKGAVSERLGQKAVGPVASPYILTRGR